MCGIAGFTGRCDPRLLDLFQGMLHHRGPDERGTLCTADVGLSINRLSVIDLVRGQQPVFNEDRSCAVVFNGEIYNYRELRADLEKRHSFESDSDTEVIIHLYEETGPSVAERLRGDFAFCIWDSRRRSCLLSRDHIGVKPLYYAVTPSGALVFSSELTVLLEHPDIQPTLDLRAVREYLTCLYVGEPRTLITGIRKLGPGESLLWTPKGIERWKYWNVPHAGAGVAGPGELESIVLDRLRTAVRRRLIADVPVGAFLSGGLDSSLIVALASEEAPGLQTFSIGYPDADFDELPYARQISKHYGTSHHEFVLEPDIRILLEQVISAMDEPIADSSAVPTFLVARETRRFVKVALSGIGGDELFFGYPRYLGAKLSEWIPAPLRSPFRLVSRGFSSRPAGRDIGGWVHRFGAGLTLSPEDRYLLWTTYLSPSRAERLLPDDAGELRYLREEIDSIFNENGTCYLDRIFRADLRRYLPSNLLKFGDTMTMAHSLELRVPFCDVDLVAAMASVPAKQRFPGLKLKPVLRSIARSLLPPGMASRKKQGFMIPIGRWFQGRLAEYLRHELTGDKLPVFLNVEEVQDLIGKHVSGQENHTHLLWAILVLARWLKEHPKIAVAGSRV